MKYFDVNKRTLWEIRHRINDPAGKQNYRMAQSIDSDQQKFEERIAKYQHEGRRLTKQMRNYLRNKTNKNV